jgi:hypothetical protein
MDWVPVNLDGMGLVSIEEEFNYINSGVRNID